LGYATYKRRVSCTGKSTPIPGDRAPATDYHRNNNKLEPKPNVSLGPNPDP